MKFKIIIVFCILFIFSFGLYNYLRIKYAKIEVELIDDMTLEFNDKKQVSDYILSINGEIIDDYVIDSSTLGIKEVNFSFINDDGIKVTYSYSVEVKDTVKPLIWLGNNYTVLVDSDDLVNKILCGDNYDSNPTCYIEGDYNLSEVGKYSLFFKAIDNSGNMEEQPFTLNVIEKSNKKQETKKEQTLFSDVVNNYKTDKTKIGIDVSSWQGDIDFSKLKEAGVEFVMIRVGGTRGTNGEYFLDKKFKQNIEEANKYDIDVGIYFYSYADNIESSIKDAKWVLKQIKGYKITLPIAFDWEEWSYFNDYHLSFFGLTNLAESFLNEISDAGYTGMLYSSKTYLENIWLDTDYDIWLAHYTNNTDYKGKYKMWQICNNGSVLGINGDVDIDILYVD